MAKAPSEARVPSSGKIPVPKTAKGAVRRTIQGSISAGSRLLPSKIKLPMLKCKFVDTNKKLIENCVNDNENKTIGCDSIVDKIPAIIDETTKNRIFVTCDKTDPEKSIEPLPELVNKTFDLADLNNLKQKDENKKDPCELHKLSESIGGMITAIIPEESNAVRTISGILRYVGHVQTDDDIWCGIETERPSPEYHDGSLNGVKYFSCKNGHGLLVPSTYVLLQCENQFVPDPKIVELRQRLQHIKSKTSKSVDDDFKPNFIDITRHLVDSEERQSDSGPYSLLVGLNTTFTKSDNQNETIVKTNECDFENSDINKTFCAPDQEPQEQTFNTPKFPSVLKFPQNVLCVSLIENETPVDFQYISMDSKCDSITNDSHRKSSIISKQYDNRELNLDNIDNNFQISSTPIHIEHFSHNNNKVFELQKPTRKQNLKPPTSSTIIMESDNNKSCQIVENKFFKNVTSNSTGLLSPTMHDNSNQELTKQNSFEESLGILTPDQMESLSFLDNIYSPSTDDFVGLLGSDNVTEKTESSSTQTPTENIKSLTPDAMKLILESKGPTREIDKNGSNDTDFNELDNTVLYAQSNDTYSVDQAELLCNVNIPSDTYEEFIQRPFKQSTAENLAHSTDLCSSAVSQTVDDELLPSVHSSILDALSSIVDTTRFDNIQHGIRMDQTPSPEELPLDPVDIKSDMSALSVDPKTDNSKSVTYSITSITSLDGYQGDGEMSRPVSRGADQSPTIGHRGVNNLQNWQNIPINRRPDPMTDSDFFTESDADGHDEQIHRGDRRAQVIDGALYGGGKASNPQVLVSRNGNSNDDSCMESSGVFTDMENHRCSPLLLNVIDDLSPEGSSPSTRSDLSQNNNSEMYHGSFNDSLNSTIVAPNSQMNLNAGDEEDKENSPQPTNSENKNGNVNMSQTATSNEKMNKDDKNMALKKYKMPRRDVASKVKSMMTSPNKCLTENHEKLSHPKKEGRWDAVMNKISVNKAESKTKCYLKDVKSKVNSSQSSEKTSLCEENSVASSTSKPKTKINLTKMKSRRVKSSRMPKIGMLDSSSRSTPHSSQSDLSVSCSAPLKNISAKHPVTRAAKKRENSGASPGRPLSPPGSTNPSQAPSTPHPTSRNRTPPAANGRPVNSLVKKPGSVTSNLTAPSTVVVNNVSSPKGIIPQRKPTTRRAATQLSPRVHKDQNRASSPTNALKTPTGVGVTVAGAPPIPTPPAKTVEALAVLVQYLVFQLDALNAPRWKAQAAGAKAQLADAASRLQKAISAQRVDHNSLTQSLTKISHLEAELRSKEAEHNAKILAATNEAESKYRAALEESSALSAEIQNLKSTLAQLKHDVAESRTRVVKAEDATRKHKAEKTALLNDLKRANEEVDKLRAINMEIEECLTIERQQAEAYRISQESKEMSKSDIDENNLSIPKTKESKMAAEIESLKSVLEMKMGELAELRKKHEDYKNAAEQLPSTLQRVATLSATVEDLRTQLNRKLQDEVNLVQQNKQLQESFSRETAMKKRLSLYNEELQYKLKQNTDVVKYLVGLQNPDANNRRSGINIPGTDQNHTFPVETFVRGQSRTTASFNEKYFHSSSFQDRRGEWRANIRKTTRSESCDKSKTPEYFQNDDSSPPNSPKVKGVVEKNDSVSWVLEIETPEEMMSRIVRRAGSFRTTTSPPAREAVKRQRSRPKSTSSTTAHSLAQSASASCIDPVSLRGPAHCKLFRSNSIEHNQYMPNRTNRTSTPRKMNGRQELLTINSPNSHGTTTLSFDDVSLSSREINSHFNDNQNDNIDGIQDSNDFDTSASIVNDDLVLLPECESVPKESAGEALISGANSEDDSSLDERSHSSSDSESGSECDKYLDMNGGEERLADPVLQKIADTMDQSLSATPMDVSWSEDGVVGVSESDI